MLAILSILAFTPTGSAVAAPAVFTSADIGFSEGGTPGDLVGRLDEMDAYAGDRKPIIRVDLDWWYVQDCRDCALRWDRLDPVVDAAAARGIRVLLILGYGPPWASGHAGTGAWFPTSDTDWTAIVDQVLIRYGHKIQAYEVWNEPNHTVFGNYGGNTAGERMARYWQLVRVAAIRVRARCADCVVLAGGSAAGTPASQERNDNESAAWLEYAYAHGYAGDFDAVAHHPYPAYNMGFGPARPECGSRWWNMFGPPDPRCGELAAVRAVMVRHGDAATKIWATEWGYPTAGFAPIAPETIRDYVVEGVHMWRAFDYTGPLFLFSYRDSAAPSCVPGSVDSECHFGVTNRAGQPKEPIFADLGAKLTDTWPATLATGSSLRRLALLRSQNGRYEFWLQGDGNLVLAVKATARVLWTSRTTAGVRLVNQPDGNVVLYDAAGNARWSTATWTAGPSALALQNDGNLVLYRGTKVVWATNTTGA